MRVFAILDRASSGRTTNRVKIQFHMPVEHTVDGVVKVAYTARFFGEFILPEELTPLSATTLRRIVKTPWPILC
jgi:hypothetical protein